jgi:hypothetical protein
VATCSLLPSRSLFGWLVDDFEDYGYECHDDFCITLIMLIITLLMLALCML